MITTNPQRWNDNLILLSNELFFQNIKNFAKKLLIIKKNK